MRGDNETLPLPEDWQRQDSARSYALYLRLRRKALRTGRRKPLRHRRGDPDHPAGLLQQQREGKR